MAISAGTDGNRLRIARTILSEGVRYARWTGDEDRNIPWRLFLWGYRTAAAGSGEAAIAHLKTHAVDLVLLDMIMAPGMDGLETYEQILEIRSNQRAVIASGYAESERVRRAIAMGAGCYVRKPYSLETLGQAVRNQLRPIP